MDKSRPCLINLPKMVDPRGNLSFIESGDHVPFDVKRVYWIYDVPGGMYRTGHAFRRQSEMIVALSGSFDVVLDDGTGEQRHHLARSYYGLYVPPMTWRKIDNFSTGAVVMVLSNMRYDPSDYIEGHDEYLAELKTYRREPAPDAPVATPDNVVPDGHATSDINDCEMLTLDRNQHPNGNLSVVEAGGQPLVMDDIRRVYYLYDVPAGEDRGGHSHRRLEQFIVAISGSFDVTIDDGVARRTITLNRPFEGLYIRPGIWRVLNNFSGGAVAMVVASSHYDEGDYIRDYDDFLAATAEKRNIITPNPEEK